MRLEAAHQREFRPGVQRARQSVKWHGMTERARREHAIRGADAELFLRAREARDPGTVRAAEPLRQAGRAGGEAGVENEFGIGLRDTAELGRRAQRRRHLLRGRLAVHDQRLVVNAGARRDDERGIERGHDGTCGVDRPVAIQDLRIAPRRRRREEQDRERGPVRQIERDRAVTRRPRGKEGREPCDGLVEIAACGFPPLEHEGGVAGQAAGHVPRSAA